MKDGNAEIARKSSGPRPSLTERNRSVRNGNFLYEDRDWLSAAYLDRHLSIQQVASEANCSYRTIARWLQIHKIPVRSMREGMRLRDRSGPGNSNWRGSSVCPGCSGRKDRAATTCMSCRPSSPRPNNPTGPRPYRWRSVVGYHALHDRLRRVRGRAADSICDHCVGPALHWAYDHQDVDEISAPQGFYSMNLDHYVPLCARCHITFDAFHARRRQVFTWTYPGTVVVVHDGDTLRADLDLGLNIYRRQAVRLAGIDAPELSTSIGKEARDYVKQLAPAGTSITVTSKSLDKYGRILGDVWLSNGRSLADLLVAQGLATAWDGEGPKPPTAARA